MGTVAPNTCGYTVRTEQKPRGYIISSTYPGVYPDSSFCYYRLQGKPGQRIKLTFEDFSLFYGGEYCPFDYLKIYDGPASDAPVIGKFCGSFNRSTVIYSTKENLRLEFITGEGRLNFIAPPMEAAADYKFERRGFNISYVFSDRFVSLDDHFIKEGAEHVSGTDCDQRIMSGKETNGTFVSPGYPAMFPEGVVCRYYLDGLMDDQYLEKVKVSFFDFNIPGNMPYCLLGYLGENEDMRLSEGTVRNKYCGSFNPPAITSGGPRMVITLNTTGAVKGGKFVARYQFITDFGIPGTPITDGKCKFHYNSAIMKNGEINSPRHPGNYALNQDCEYIFRPLFDEVVIISFSVFHLSSQDSPPCNAGGDYVAFYEDLGTLNRENFTLTEKYCGKYYPGPYATTRLLKLVFFSDERETFPGFKATYKFVKKQNLTCPTHNNQISGRGTGGVIVSPSVSGKYMSQVWCEWVIHASKRENKILIEISELSIEGVFMKGAERSNCEVAVLRLYDDSMGVRPSAAVCGMKKVTDITQSYLSLQDSFKISFLTSAASLGAKGFKISWTEVHIGSSPSGDCSGFQCVINKFCIAPTLKCNKEPNCGQGDDSDETAECPKSSGIQILHIAIGTSISSFFCIILLICGFYHRRKFRSDRAPPDHDHVEVRYVSAPTGCNTTDRLLMEDRNDVGNDHHNNS
ncbi:unnamed protein product, partial [Lymnaea stagnalis]